VRGSGSKTGQQRHDWEAARLLYFDLGARDRSYGKVAERLGIPEKKVVERGRKEKWVKLAKEFDSKALAEAEKRKVREHGERLAELFRLVDEFHDQFSEALKQGKVPLTASDYTALMKLALALGGEVTDRTDGRVEVLLSFDPRQVGGERAARVVTPAALPAGNGHAG
jgi:uncharacterized protein YcaQ